MSVLSRTAQVGPGGEWRIPDVPVAFGQLRARVTCREPDGTLFGQSEFFTVSPNGTVTVESIEFEVPEAIPARVTVAAPARDVIVTAGGSMQLEVAAEYASAIQCPDGSVSTVCDVTAGTSGVNYTSSNEDIAVVSADGLVSAPVGGRSGIVVITAMLEGALAIRQVRVELSVDSDGDGCLDDVEVQVGLDPDDWTDGLLDFDGDGLTNSAECEGKTFVDDPDSDGDLLLDGEESSYGTNPLDSDTDDDFLPDSVEVATDTDPNDPSDGNWTEALTGDLAVEPASATLILLPPDLPEVQLAVTGSFANGLSIDLLQADPLDRIPDTLFSSSDSDVCGVALNGLVTGGPQAGSCSVTVENSGHSGSAEILVTSGAIAYRELSLPAGGQPVSEANAVDVVGDRAYVAAGPDGLLVVDISNRMVPEEIAIAAGTPGGSAKDVKVRNGYAFVAAGPAGLDVYDLDGAGDEPELVANLDLDTDCVDLDIFGRRAFIAASDVGLQIVDLVDPLDPVLVSTTEVPGFAAIGVAAQDEIADYTPAGQSQASFTLLPSRAGAKPSVNALTGYAR